MSPHEQSLTISGPLGDLQAKLYDTGEASNRTFAIICHPHSLHGGTMDNKVVTTMARACRDAGLSYIRFNFRGVGESVGQYDKGVGETDDVLAIARWLEAQYANFELILSGFSFGSYVSYRARVELKPKMLISIAPPIPNFPFDDLPLPSCPWLVIQGCQDEVIAADDVYGWLQDKGNPATLIRFAEAGHFFHGKLVELREHLTDALK